MDTKERMFVIEQKARTLPGVAVARTVTFPEISIAELERDLADEAAFEELETSETIEMPVPAAIHDSDDEEGPTGIFNIQPWQAGAEVYWVQRV